MKWIYTIIIILIMTAIGRIWDAKIESKQVKIIHGGVER